MENKTHEEIAEEIERARKYEAVCNAMRYSGDIGQTKQNERAEIYLFTENIDEEVKKILTRNIWEDNIGGTSDLGYEICNSACNLISDTAIEDLEESEDTFYESESASVYTADRLSYLNNNNQNEISEKMKEYSTEDIATACAIWYDDMVRSVALELKDYILND